VKPINYVRASEQVKPKFRCEEEIFKMKENRSEPKPRKHPNLMQAAKKREELSNMRVRDKNRISSIERGTSGGDLEYANQMLGWSEGYFKNVDRHMINEAKAVSCWKWINGIRGCGSGSLPAQLLAEIDDIGKFRTISNLWSFAGYGLEDGKCVRNKKGVKSKKNRDLQAICWNIADTFIKHQTPVYVDMYYGEKARQRKLHPDKVGNDEKGTYDFTDQHLHYRAIRKMMKLFLSHLWLKWREAEGLPVTDPYAIAIMKHTHFIAPPEGLDERD
jgi:hypothetical protein